MFVEGLGDLPCFPCNEDKRPLVKAWPTAATKVEPQPHWPLVGVPTGDASGFSVVDVDLEGLGWFDQQHLPLTRLHHTRSGGLHLLLRHPSGLRNSSSEIAPGVDVRGDGGMIIWWPREGYDVCSAPLAEWPMELMRQRVRIPKETPALVPSPDGVMLVTPGSREGRYATAALRNAFAKLAKDWPWAFDQRDRRTRPRRGGRSDLLNKLAFKMGGLVANGWLSSDRVMKVLMVAAKDCWLVRDYGEAKCRATIVSGLKAGMLLPYDPLDTEGTSAGVSLVRGAAAKPRRPRGLRRI
jgi:hypothetical protein